MILRAAFLCLILTTMIFLPVEAFAQECRASSSGISFGDISNAGTSQVTISGIVEVHCVPTANMSFPVRVCLHLDAGSGGNTVNDRLISTGTAGLSYQLFRDPAMTALWGESNDALVVDFPSMENGRNSMSVNVYAVLYGGQVPVEDGPYTSDFNMTVLDTTDMSLPCQAVGGRARKGNFSVEGTVSTFCTITASDLVFPQTADFDSVITGTGQIGLFCPTGVPYSLSLDGGSISGDTGNRQMALDGSGPDMISYQLYTDPAHSVVWGDGVTGGLLEGSGTGATDVHTVYGEIPVQVTPTAGRYTDQITATVVF